MPVRFEEEETNGVPPINAAQSSQHTSRKGHLEQEPGGGEGGKVQKFEGFHPTPPGSMNRTPTLCSTGHSTLRPYFVFFRGPTQVSARVIIRRHTRVPPHNTQRTFPLSHLRTFESLIGVRPQSRGGCGNMGGVLSLMGLVCLTQRHQSGTFFFSPLTACGRIISPATAIPTKPPPTSTRSLSGVCSLSSAAARSR